VGAAVVPPPSDEVMHSSSSTPRGMTQYGRSGLQGSSTNMIEGHLTMAASNPSFESRVQQLSRAGRSFAVSTEDSLAPSDHAGGTLAQPNDRMPPEIQIQYLQQEINALKKGAEKK